MVLPSDMTPQHVISCEPDQLLPFHESRHIWAPADVHVVFHHAYYQLGSRYVIEAVKCLDQEQNIEFDDTYDLVDGSGFLCNNLRRIYAQGFN